MKTMSVETQEVYCGIDFHKNTSTLCFLTIGGQDAMPMTRVRTSHLSAFLSNKRFKKIGIEASGGVNHLTEVLKSQGHEVVIINSNKFRGIAIGGKKTDERDARALAEALRFNLPEVHLRSKYARQIKSLLTTREHVVQARVDSINHVRATLREYGIVMPAGPNMFYEHARKKVAELELVCIRECLILVLENIERHLEQERQIEQQLKILTANDERLTSLETIPGIGVVTSRMMVAVIDDISRFKNAKEFASYLGLVPSVHASSQVRMMGAITRSGSEMLRRYLVHGARAWMRYAPKTDRNRIWAEKVKERRGMNRATVALAHRMARIAFAILRDQSTYRETKKLQAA